MKRKGFSVSGKARDKQQSHSAVLDSQVSPEQVTVTLLLAGGQEYTIAIDPNDGLLQDLYETLMLNDPQATKHLFQIPIHNGQAVLAFPSDRLVGLITEPPLIIERQDQPEPSVIAQSHDPLISEYLQIDNFLTDAEHQQLLNYVLQRQPDFQPTTTFTGAANYRESVVLYSFPDFEDLFRKRLQQIFPSVVQQFGIAPFQLTSIESQLTAHNDGQFYKVHNDNGSQDTATRELTYVYYFYREPKSFTGGELVIYDSKVENNYYVQADTFKTVEPRNNSIVFFLSRYMHEVLPVRCHSGDFVDSRFTINGWFRR